MSYKKKIILGCGPTGIGCALGFLESGEDLENILIIEKSTKVGGLSGSFKFDGDIVDYGPHRLSPKIAKVVSIAKLACGKELHEKKSDHGVYINQRLYSFPPKISEWLNYESLKFITSFLSSFIFFKIIYFFCFFNKNNDFEKTLIKTFGKYFYKKIINPMAIKVWGRSKELDVTFVNTRFSQLKLSQFILKKISPRKDLNPENFFYPKFGYQQLWDSICNKQLKNINLQTNTVLKKIKIKNNLICEIQIENKKKNKTVTNIDSLISSIPIYDLINILDNFDKSGLMDELKTIKIRSMYLFIFKFNQKKTLPMRTLIFPQSNILFNRIFEQNSYSESTVEKNKSIIVGDITADLDNDIYKDQDLKKVGIQELKKIKFINLEALEKMDVKFVKYAYAVPTTESINAFRNIEKKLTKIQNLYLAGRFGSGDYDNSDYAIINGINIAEFINKKIDQKEYLFKKDTNKKNIIHG